MNYTNQACSDVLSQKGRDAKKRCKLHTKSLKYYCIFQLKMKKKFRHLPSVVFIAVMLVGPSKCLKQKI